ncbi:single-stranded DNA-binding protein [Candidatus Phytoplasma sacchari]|uniref:Single-stranded DNA-binding protein n=1 Tax=Candidatus Phytoplasma sacchari TaxID=2609813 RepID=A0ABY7M1B1_9MOLU|nr:single-stranded DNA-binding protein [Candidatus Phytoplasma sacchari]
MINKVILVGRITKEPELRFVNEDIPLVRFTLAVDRNFVNSLGNKETDFIRCVIWRKQAENLARYVSQGALLGVEGNIRVNSFENENNQKQYITEISCISVYFLESKKNRIKQESNTDFNDEKKDSSFNKINLKNLQNNTDIEKETDLEEDVINIEEEDGLPF